MLLAPKVEDATRRIMAVFDEFHPYDQVILMQSLAKHPDFARVTDKVKRREALAEMAKEAQRLDLD